MRIDELFTGPGENLVLCKAETLEKDIVFQPFFVADGLWYGILKGNGAATFKESKDDWIPIEITEINWVRKWKWVYQANGTWSEYPDYLSEDEAEFKIRAIHKEKLQYTEKMVQE
jgi:hypothetical protein